MLRTYFCHGLADSLYREYVYSFVLCGRKSGDCWTPCFFSCCSSGLRPHAEMDALLTRLMSSVFSQDSLAAEIEGTMRKELQLEEPESPDITYGCMTSIFQVFTN